MLATKNYVDNKFQELSKSITETFEDYIRKMLENNKLLNDRVDTLTQFLKASEESNLRLRSHLAKVAQLDTSKVALEIVGPPSPPTFTPEP